MNGITKVIDELGLIILSKEIEIESQQEQLEKLKQKIESLERYVSIYDEFCNTKQIIND